MENRYFQFLAGERRGEILTFNKIEQEDGEVFIAFKDDSRCNEDFILPLNETAWEGKLMAEISSPENRWKLSEEWVGREEERWEINKDGERVCVQPLIPGRKKTIAIPPKRTKTKFGITNSIIETIKHQEPIINNDPVYIMVEKSKKFDTKICMDIIVSLPAKSLYNVVKESFEEGSTKIIDYIINNLDNTKLKESLRSALLTAYEENYLYQPEEIEKPVIGEARIPNIY
jgi:hypothetical protein